MPLVPFSRREADFDALKVRVKERFGDKLDLWITNVGNDRYGLYRPRERKAVVLICGADLATFDLDTVQL